MWFCYILRNRKDEYKHCTYNGSTNNPIRRLRQHNCEIKGGAKATSRTCGGWEIIALLSGFPDHINALSCEWRFKCPSGRPGKRGKEFQGPIGRIKSLNEILKLPQWTGQCKILNNSFKMKLIILDEYESYIERTSIPENIELIIVENMEEMVSDKYLELNKEIY